MARSLRYVAYTCLAGVLLVVASLNIVGCSGGLEAATMRGGGEEAGSISVALAGEW